MSKTFLSKFIDAQGELSSIEPNAKNPHYKSEYVTLSACENLVRPVFQKYKLGYTFKIMLMSDLYFVNLVVFDENTIFDNHNSYITSSVKLIMQKNDMQGLGSAITYAKRYLLMALLGFSSGEDDDDGNNSIGKVIELEKKGFNKDLPKINKIESVPNEIKGIPNKAPSLLLLKVIEFAKTKHLTEIHVQEIATKLFNKKLYELSDQELNTLGAQIKITNNKGE